MGKINTNIKNFLKNIVSDESGNAIILALIIIAGLAGTGIGAARLTKSNTQQASIYEDSLKAYYAAEAGVESALLEWRFDHDVEFWDRDEALDCFNESDNTYDHCDAAKVRKYVMLGGDEVDGVSNSDLADRFDQNGKLKEGSSAPKNQAWYEMQIYYRDPKNPYLGNFLDEQPWVTNEFYPTNADLPRIGKDETMEIAWPESDGVKYVNIYWSADLGVYDLNNYARLLVHPVKADGGDAELVNEKNVTDEVFYSNEALGKQKNKKYDYKISSVPEFEFDNLKSVRIKCLSNVDNYPLNDYIYPTAGTFVAIRAQDENRELIHMPGKKVYINVIGHYGDTERKLEYTIDRQSGTILDIFDHGVYSKETLRK